jgi:hypothetical protein
MLLPTRVLLFAVLSATACWADQPQNNPNNPTQAPPPGPMPAPPSTSPSPTPPSGTPTTTAPHWLSRWFDPSTAPFIPVPEIGVDPNSGVTLGLIPTWLQSNDDHEIDRIIAPDILYNPNFGVGVHGRIYGYSSVDEQWSVVGGIKERVERDFDAEYQVGRSRQEAWSFNTSVIFDRSGVPRFYGIGNGTLLSAQTNYTDQQEVVQVQAGRNLTHEWQLLYTGRFMNVDVLPGTLSSVPTIQSRFDHVVGLGTNQQLLNRLSIVYDTRDDLTIPTRGMQLIAYGGLASRTGLLNDSMYSEAGGDGRAFWPLAPDSVLAGHLAIRYLPTSHNVPFWALSDIGGDTSVVGGEQPLRGFGEGRFYDRDSFSSSVEFRRKVLSFDASTTTIDVEVTPFIDVGRVYARTSTDPLSDLHRVYGVGFRGIAKPFVVGYVDIGYGTEGVAAFTGLNYPF